MRTLLFVAPAAMACALLLFACGAEEAAFNFVSCRTHADCSAVPGTTCGGSGYCVSSVDGPGRDLDSGGTIDVGSGDTGTAEDSGPAVLDTTFGNDTCTPSCSGRECGSDGCGGTCGTCAVGDTCQAGVCTGGGTGGDLDCAGIVDCVNDEGCTTEACIEACLAEGTSVGQSEFIDVIACIQENCAEITDDTEFAECQNSLCSAELDACFDGGGSTGADSCDEVIDCAVMCPDVDCANACVADGTPGAQSASVAYFNCAVEACPDATTVDEFLACARAECPSEAADCDAN